MQSGNTEPPRDYHHFKQPHLFWQAVTHRSWLNEHPSSKDADYQRLELLGDAVLKLLHTTFFYQTNPLANEGDLSTMRNKHEADSVLGRLCQTMQLDQWIRHGHSVHNNAKDKAWQTICADVFEAFMGAIWLDTDYNFPYMYQLYTRIHPLIQLDTPQCNPKGQLQEHLQKQHLPLPSYKLIERSGPDHQPLYTVCCTSGTRRAHSTQSSIKEAEIDAATRLLEQLHLSPS